MPTLDQIGRENWWFDMTTPMRRRALKQAGAIRNDAAGIAVAWTLYRLLCEAKRRRPANSSSDGAGIA